LIETKPDELLSQAGMPPIIASPIARGGYGSGYGGGHYGTTIAAPRPVGPFSAEETAMFRLIVQLPDNCPNAKAEEFARDLIDNLKLALMRASDEHRNRLNAQAESVREETKRCENELRSLQIDLRKVSGSRSLDRGDLLREIASLRNQIESREMNKATSSAYVDSITKQIAENQAKLEERLQADEVTKELAEIVQSNAEGLARIEQLVKDGRAPAAELNAPQEKLARAKIDLAKRREELGKSGSGMIEALTRKLTDLATESSRTDAEIINLKRQLEEATQFLERAGDYEILSLRADAAMQNLREMIVLSSQLERRIRLVQPPQVSVIGAE
jgi:chromosome segregation ATPase